MALSCRKKARNGDFCCINCFHSFKKHKNICENHDYCYVEMPKEDNKILKYNRGEKKFHLLFMLT